jgi:hypothetical protein
MTAELATAAPLTGAERQRRFRQRRADRMAALEAEAERLRDENERLRAEFGSPRPVPDQGGVNTPVRPAVPGHQGAAGAPCRHPSNMVEGDYCHACGADIV